MTPPTGISGTATPSGGFRHWSTNAKRIFGLAPDSEVTAEVFASLLHSDDSTRFDAAFTASLQPDGPDALEFAYRIRRANDGAERSIKFCGRVVIEGQDQGRFVGAIRDITEESPRVEREESSKTDLQLFVAQSPAAIAIFDRDMRHLATSSRWMRMFHLTESPNGRNHYDVFPDLPESMKAVHRRCLAGAVESNDAERFERADGHVQWSKWEARPWRDGDGEIGGIILFCEDITERVEAEKALRQSDLLLRRAAIAARLVYLEFDLAGQCVRAGENFEHVMGYKPRNLADRRMEGSGFGLLQHVPERDRPMVSAMFEDIVGGKDGELQFRLVGDDGVERWFRIQWISEWGDDGSMTRVLAICLDITAAKAGEQALRRSQARLLRAADAAGLTYVQIDLAVQRAFVADNYEKVMGYKPLTPPEGGTLAEAQASLLGNVAPADRAAVSALFANVFAGKGGQIKFRVIGDDGVERWFLGGGNPEFDSSGSNTRFFATLLEVTAVESALNALRQSKLEAERANSAKSDFLATMSHEIRTPMNGVVGMTTLLEDTSLSTEQRHYVKCIRQSGEALVELLDNILDFSKLEAGQLEIERCAFSPLALAENVLDILEPTASRKKLRMELSIQGEPPALAYGDAMRLRQILLNLTGNAIKFTGSGRVALRLIGLAGDRLRFEVEDTGIGVPEKERDRLFKVFSQVDPSITRKFGGSGLGLAICKRMIEAMGGRIDFDSTPGAGSLFWIEVPIEAAVQEVLLAPPPVARKKAALICSVERGRGSAADVLAASGFDLGDPDAAELIFVDAEQASAAAEQAGAAAEQAGGAAEQAGGVLKGPVERARKLVAFGDESAHFEARFAAVIGGALTPGRLARMLESLEKAEPRREEPRNSVGASKRRLKILVADDTETNQLVLVGLLRGLGHEAEIAINGLDALQMVKSNAYDLIFMDVHMPEMDGLEATRRIRRLSGEKASLRIVAVSASAFASDIEVCRMAGMDGFISKPIDRAKLSAALEETSSSGMKTL